MQRFGQCVINETAIAWANLDRTHQEDHVTYRYEREFTIRDRVERVTKSAIYVRFVDGSFLMWPTSHPDYQAVRAWLTGVDAPVMLPIETEIIAGLPSELQQLFK